MHVCMHMAEVPNRFESQKQSAHKFLMNARGSLFEVTSSKRAPSNDNDNEGNDDNDAMYKMKTQSILYILFISNVTSLEHVCLHTSDLGSKRCDGSVCLLQFPHPSCKYHAHLYKFQSYAGCTLAAVRISEHSEASRQ